MYEIGKKPCITVDAKFYHSPEVFGNISHYEGNHAIIVREDIPLCLCCNQPMPHMTKVLR